jgi:hypothetical protein
MGLYSPSGQVLTQAAPRLKLFEYFFTKDPERWQARNNDHRQGYKKEVGFYPRVLANPVTQCS